MGRVCLHVRLHGRPSGVETIRGIKGVMFLRVVAEQLRWQLFPVPGVKTVVAEELRRQLFPVPGVQTVS